MYSEETNHIRVEVVPAYIPEYSNVNEGIFFFAYRVRITNAGDRDVKLLGRHWIINDGRGKQEHVVGDGVVGAQPIIAATDFYEYTSFCPLNTPTGNMRGTYEMEYLDGEKFKIRIPLFFLRKQDIAETVSENFLN